MAAKHTSAKSGSKERELIFFFVSHCANIKAKRQKGKERLSVKTKR